MRRKWRRAKLKQEKFFRVNYQIKIPEVFLIDENNEKKGIIATEKALLMAQEACMDLVEVDPTTNPSVVKILDLGQLKYERDKKKHKQKLQQKKVGTKCIRLSLRISKYDTEIRLKQAIKFIEKGQKLKIELILKGREKQYFEKAREIMNEFAHNLEKQQNLNIIREQNLTRQDGKFTMILVNKKN